MKTTFNIIISLLIVTSLYGQKSCCSKSLAGETFAQLTNDKNFIAAHLEPEPFHLSDASGKMITYKTPSGKESQAYEIKCDSHSDKYIFVFHEWWGLNDYVKQECEKLFKELKNVNVIAVDLYNKKVATDRDSAAKYMQAVNYDDAEDVIRGVLNYVGKKAHIATIGWCFGGGWSLQCAILAGKQAKSCVMYYGMPEEKKEKLKTLNAPVLFVFAEQDQWINKQVISTFEEKMKELKKPMEVISYNAVHGFANPSNPKYAKAFSEEAFVKSTTFIKNNFK
ncbi:MAG: dienelactone hydrolase family protein [Bacteroidetes bacterium]|nr:dienelactone hydrolase family protein [Bacteroidota bacterium]